MKLVEVLVAMSLLLFIAMLQQQSMQSLVVHWKNLQAKRLEFSMIAILEDRACSSSSITQDTLVFENRSYIYNCESFLKPSMAEIPWQFRKCHVQPRFVGQQVLTFICQPVDEA